jgi:GNAT superfamily N-acetyltransferase
VLLREGARLLGAQPNASHGRDGTISADPDPAMPMKFGPDYREDVDLRAPAGGRIRLRPIGPGDKAKLQEGLMHLSSESQVLRFFTAKPHFTEKELSYLTEVDGHDHFALAAVRVLPDGSEGEGVGVARFVRLPGEATVAEPAVVVVDQMQNLGIGTLLMNRLVEAATERGVAVFRSEFLARNAAIRDLLSRISPQIRFESQGPIVVAEVPLRPATEIAVASPGAHPTLPPDILSFLREALKVAANEGMELRNRFRMLLDPERVLEAWREFRNRDGSDRSDE